MLNIHSSSGAPDQRNTVSAAVESTGSLTVFTADPIVWIRVNDVTTPGVATDTPLASQTRNLTGTVDPCLNTPAQIPVPLIIVMVAPPPLKAVTEQTPVAPMVTAPPEPAVAATEKLVPYIAEAGAFCVIVIDWFALVGFTALVNWLAGL